MKVIERRSRHAMIATNLQMNDDDTAKSIMVCAAKVLLVHRNAIHPELRLGESILISLLGTNGTVDWVKERE